MLMTGDPRGLAVVSILLGSSFVFAAPPPEPVPFRFTGNLRVVEQVQLSLPNATIRLDGHVAGKGSLVISRVKGPQSCKASAVMHQGILYVAEESALHEIFPESVFETKETDDDAASIALPEIAREIPKPRGESSDCAYRVEYESPEPSDARLEVDGATDIEVSHWAEPLQVVAGTGTVAFAKIGELDLRCRSCDLSGEDADGSLHYQIGVGTVGMTQLSGTVDGVSKGDVKLNWRKVKVQTQIRIVSEAGDVTLNIPRSHSLALSLSAPRGDVHIKGSGSSQGIPVHVEAKAGTIRMVGQ